MSGIIKTPLRSGEPVVQVSVVGPEPMPVLKFEALLLSWGTLLLGPNFYSFWACTHSTVLYCLLSLHEVLSQSIGITPAACLDCGLAALHPESLQSLCKAHKVKLSRACP